MNHLLDQITPAQALGIELSEWDGRRVTLSAPLEPNRNDKGTAFAGSIDALLDLAGWSAITLALRDAGIEAEVMIVKSKTEYMAAARSDMTATATITKEETDRMMAELQARGRSRTSLSSSVESGNERCAAAAAHYAVIAKR